jgi:serine/threonine protein kinase
VAAERARAPTELELYGDRIDEQSSLSLFEVVVGASGRFERIGPYRILGLLGKGGMGVVYEATREAPSDGTTYALKTLDLRELPGASALRRFQQEIAVLESLDHPGIVRIHDAGLARHPQGYEFAFFVAERLEGSLLIDLLKKSGMLPLAEALRITEAIANALEYLAEENVQHRDIKPSNIMLANDGRVVLIDFGIARSQELTRLTQAGYVLGTPLYMSPERHLGQSTEISSDVYSLGVLLFRMLTGELPFGDNEEHTVLLSAIRGGVIWSRGRIDRVHGTEVSSLIDAMLAFHPDERPTPSEIRKTIPRLLGERDASHSASRGVPWFMAIPLDRISSEIEVGEPLHEDTAKIPTLDPIPVSRNDPTETLESAASIPIARSVLVTTAVRAPDWRRLRTYAFAMSIAAFAFLAGVLFDRWESPQPAPEAGAPSAAAETIATAREASPEPDEQEAERAPIEPTPVSSEGSAAVPDFADARAAFEYGARAAKEGRHRAAIEAFERAVELNPAFALAHRRLGDEHWHEGEPARAAHHYRTYVALRPHAPDLAEVQRRLRAAEPP